MAEFIGHLQSFNPCVSTEVNSNLELQGNCIEAYENNVNSADGHGLMRFCNDIFPDQQYSTPFPVNSMHNQNLGISHPNNVPSTLPFGQPSQALFGPINGKQVITDNSATPSAPPAFGFVSTGRNDKSLGARKRKRNVEKEVEKPKEVVHVRAKRGQATDSHSLAERVRREKINERLKSLQDLVPGCYKTMGMAVMLDVVINYVQSLQNQIEFLSMKLSAASMFYDFNLTDLDAVETMQARNAYGAAEMESIREDYGSDIDHLPFTWTL